MAKTFKNLLLMNHWPECLDIWYGSSYGQGDSRQLGYLNCFIIANTKWYASLYRILYWKKKEQKNPTKPNGCV